MGKDQLVWFSVKQEALIKLNALVRHYSPGKQYKNIKIHLYSS